MDIGEATKIAFKRANMSNAELARKLDTSPQNVTHILKTQNPRIDRVLKLAKVFNMTVDQFIEIR